MKIFGKFCILVSLMGVILKGEDKLIIRIDIDGYIKNIVVNLDVNGNIKGYFVNIIDENFDGLGKGIMRIIKDMGLKEFYVVISNIDYLNLFNDISVFFYNLE